MGRVPAHVGKPRLHAKTKVIIVDPISEARAKASQLPSE